MTAGKSDMEFKTVRHTLLTGASSGIGRATAIELSKDYNLILHGRNKTKLEETRRLCHPGNHLIWTYDLANVESLQKDFEFFVQSAGVVIEQFVHCAGIASLTAVKTIDIDLCRHVLDINAISAILLASTLLKSRVAGKTMKSIVMISSISATQASRGKSLYGISKGMLNAFARSSAVELAPKVRINTICPAAVRTEMANDVFNDTAIRAAMEFRHPMGTGLPEDIAGVVSFLLSDKARWITGAQIAVDGGASCDFTFKPMPTL